MTRYLTKSRFKLALECPTKLFYTRKDEYENTKADDEFLQSLAEGGYQVGELAKCYYPGGHDITEAEYEIPLKRTNELLLQDEVVIFEAAIQYQHLFVRVDILEKKGNTIRLIEVKAKSTDGSDFMHFLNKSGGITKEWKPYLYDVAFQHLVVKSAFPEMEITCYLMLADKNVTSSVDGLNQRFPIHKIGDGKIAIEKNSDLSNADFGTPLLKEINVDTIIEQIQSDGIDGSSFEELVHAYASAYESDTKIKTPLGIQCGSCEFKTFSNTKKSGFHECWKDQTRLTDSDLSKPMVFDLWNFRGVEKLLNEGTYLLKDLEKSAFGEIKPGPFGALSTKERQWLQVEKEKENDRTPYLDTSLFFIKKQEFIYPLHFIDFETSMVAIPFNKEGDLMNRLLFSIPIISWRRMVKSDTLISIFIPSKVNFRISYLSGL